MPNNTMKPGDELDLDHYSETESDDPVECLGKTFENDQARREYYLELLAEKLKDPEFRKIEGFPIGEDEDILELSDPPYYTACPNPFIEKFITFYGRPYDPEEGYKREPYAVDVSEGKNTKIYRAHSYHTKVPPKAITSLLTHYTEPNDIVLDAFSGSGMTGLASQEVGRRTVLCDLAPGATSLARYYNSFPEPSVIKTDLEKLIQHVENKCRNLFEVEHDKKITGVLNYAILSEVFFCPTCSEEFPYWYFDEDKCCPHCGAEHKKTDLQRKITANGKTQVVPVKLFYFINGKRFEREATVQDRERFNEVDGVKIPFWYPTDLMMHSSGAWGDYHRAGYHQGFNRVSDFYTTRNLYAISCMWSAIEELRLCDFMKFVITSLLAMRCSLRMPYRTGGRSAGAINNLHIPSLIQEYNPIEVLKRKGKAFVDAAYETPRGDRPVQTTQSSTQLVQIPENSIDYIFVDPPFGNNIIYSELNFLWEAWFKVFSKQDEEAIVSDHQQKGFLEYGELISSCFKELYRVIKPGRWMTVEFSNTKASVWNSIQNAINDSGFIVANVSALDKKQGSYKAVSTPTAVKQDLIISAYKPNGGFEKRFFNESNEDGVWDFMRTHLSYLPTVKKIGDVLSKVPERDPRILFDQVVAYFVRSVRDVPLSSREFQEGLSERFAERDGMIFLPEQVVEYDKARISSTQLRQLTIFVDDEASAIEWLRQLLNDKPQTYQDIHPKFISELSGWKKAEEQLELSKLLDQNFIKYESGGSLPPQIHSYLSTNFKDKRNLSKDDPQLIAKAKDRWYVPNPDREEDMQIYRERDLLKQFEEYISYTGRKLKTVRLEAVRCGFKKAWQDRDYVTIISVAEKIPKNLLQEDQKLLMWYDQAQTRHSDESLF